MVVDLWKCACGALPQDHNHGGDDGSIFVLPSRAHSELLRGCLTSVEHTATASGDWLGDQSFKKQQKISAAVVVGAVVLW